MQSSATLRYLRIAPRKVRLLADGIKGKRVLEAEHILGTIPKGAAEPLRKTLRSAVASGKHNFQLDEANLYISKLVVAEGPKLKRYRPRARGRAYPIEKKTSHITVVLEEIDPTSFQQPKKVQESIAPSAAPVLEKKEQGLGEKRRFRPEKEMRSGKWSTGIQRIFRRKAV